jgi:hypothetical protein
VRAIPLGSGVLGWSYLSPRRALVALALDQTSQASKSTGRTRMNPQNEFKGR